MSGRRNALLTGPLVLVAGLVMGFSPNANARTRAEDGEDQARPAETGRAPARDLRNVEMEEDDAAPRPDRMRDRRRDMDEDVVDRREPRRDRGGYDNNREWFRDPGYYGYGNFPGMEVH